MLFDDNRQFIAALDKTGDVVHIRKEVDWDMQVGAIIRRTHELQAPAPLFENIKDYPGYRIFGGPLATYKRVAISWGMSADSSIRDVHEEFERRIQKLIPPVIVKDGPCKENKLFGDDIDLFRFPVPYVHEGDGGRYIGAWHMDIVKDPESNWVNWGMYRVMVHNKRHVGVLWHMGNDGGKIFYRNYVPKKKPMPVAIAIGADPICSLVAASTFGVGRTEAEYAGALRGKPVELVKCETNDLYVPATAEIILEGEVLPNVLIPEGPFGEYSGYRTPGGMIEVTRLKAITFRKDPILTISNPGIPIDDSAVAYLFPQAITLKGMLKRHGIPVTDVYVPPEGSGFVAIVGVKATEPNLLAKIKELMHPTRGLAPKVIIVEDDVDVFNLDQVLHALATKFHPVRGLMKSELGYTNPLTPYLTPEERRGESKARGVLFDATWPAEWSRDTDVPPRVSFEEMYPKELKNKIVKGWRSYGFK